MASVWKKAMLYLGLGPDEEYDDYVADQPPPAPEYERAGVPGPAGYGAPPPGAAAVGAAAPAPGAVGGYGQVRSFPQPQAEPLPERIGPASGIGTVGPARSRPVVRPLAATVHAKPHVMSPSSFNDAQELADHFKTTNPVIMNLQAADRDLARRLIDFASGLCYGLGGSMEKVANQVYLLTPTNVEVSAEERRRLERGLYSG
jgi:cell division inhibitor SepF